jgi:hypothetical protein
MPIPKHVNDLGREQAVYMLPACEHMQGPSLHSHQRESEAYMHLIHPKPI